MNTESVQDRTVHSTVLKQESVCSDISGFGRLVQLLKAASSASLRLLKAGTARLHLSFTCTRLRQSAGS